MLSASTKWKRQPLGASIIQNNSYADDLRSGRGRKEAGRVGNDFAVWRPSSTHFSDGSWQAHREGGRSESLHNKTPQRAEHVGASCHGDTDGGGDPPGGDDATKTRWFVEVNFQPIKSAYLRDRSSGTDR
jgi:hypothetical protein